MKPITSLPLIFFFENELRCGENNLVRTYEVEYFVIFVHVMLMMCSLLYFTNSTSSFRFEASKTSFSDSDNLDLLNSLGTSTTYKKFWKFKSDTDTHCKSICTFSTFLLFSQFKNFSQTM